MLDIGTGGRLRLSAFSFDHQKRQCNFAHGPTALGGLFEPLFQTPPPPPQAGRPKTHKFGPHIGPKQNVAVKLSS